MCVESDRIVKMIYTGNTIYQTDLSLLYKDIKPNFYRPVHFINIKYLLMNAVTKINRNLSSFLTFIRDMIFTYYVKCTYFNQYENQVYEPLF